MVLSKVYGLAINRNMEDNVLDELHHENLAKQSLGTCVHSVRRSSCIDQKKKPKLNRMQLIATRPSVAVTSFGSSFSCQLAYFLNTQKPTKDWSQSVATGLLTVYTMYNIYSKDN